jgi:GT2 family glycosyltransferase
MDTNHQPSAATNGVARGASLPASRETLAELREELAAQRRDLRAQSAGALRTKAPKGTQPAAPHSEDLAKLMADAVSAHRKSCDALERAARKLSYSGITLRLREDFQTHLPAGAVVLVVSGGDDELLQLDGRTGWHFPQTADGAYAGDHPAESASAILHLEVLRAKGARYLAFPSTAFWWLRHYFEFLTYLDTLYGRVLANDDVILYRLDPKSSTIAGPEARSVARSDACDDGRRDTGGQPAGSRNVYRKLAVSEYRHLVSDLRGVVEETVPRGATVLVASRGDPQLLLFRERQGWHFPQGPAGIYAGHYPADSAAAIAHLESLIVSGAQYLLFPNTAFWWLDHYQDLQTYLNEKCCRVADDDRFILFRISNRPNSSATDGHSAKGAGDSLRRSNAEACAEVTYDPGHIFDAEWYLDQNPDARESGLGALDHYLRFGVKAGYSPHPLFDAEFYRRTYPEHLLDCQDSLRHYATTGWKLGCKPNPSFDPEFYLSTYPDVAASGVEPLTHFIVAGKCEGRVGNLADMRVEPFHAPFEISREPLAAPALFTPRAKAIAFYLPQFHPIPQNDAWWGEGFTEWTNVRRGAPQFEGHYQPHVPTTLGYYDLRDEQTLVRQVDLARQYGIYGFCFYYYWFDKTVLLDLPIRRLLATGKPDFPFCICWANENWTRRWDGQAKEVLIAQRHSAEDDLAFIRHVEPILTQKNYIRVDGKPLLLVYRPHLLPDAAATLARWRDYFRSRGHAGLHLAMTRSFQDKTSHSAYGFDSAVQFPPHTKSLTPVTRLFENRAPVFEGALYDYGSTKAVFLQELERTGAAEVLYPGVMPSWDNCARRTTKAHVWVNSSPESYHDWLSRAADHVQARRSREEQFLFINAWNEWAEGCHVEPDTKYGFGWLNATRLALEATPSDVVETASQTLPLTPRPGCTQSVTNDIASSRATVSDNPRAANQTALRFVISVLFYHREDILRPFLERLLPQVQAATQDPHLDCELRLAFNYEPTATARALCAQLTAPFQRSDRCRVTLVEHGHNLGFGAGHNAAFERSESDVFLMLNSDVQMEASDWIRKVAEQFRKSDVALLGLSSSASVLREDGCGVPVGRPGIGFDFVDGSVLAVRSAYARKYGLFSDAFAYFYFEDADLCLRYRRLGLRIEAIDLAHQHERSSSSRLVPKYLVENILDSNRARFFARWGTYLRTRRLSNTVAVRFRTLDRTVQCASLAALLGLLREHVGIRIEVSGVHAQLLPLFRHENIHTVPVDEGTVESECLQVHDIGDNLEKDRPIPFAIAARIGCDPDFDAATKHLRSLAASTKQLTSLGDRRGERAAGPAVLYLARRNSLFEGRQPDNGFAASMLRCLRAHGLEILVYSEFADFEDQATPIDPSEVRRVYSVPTGDLLHDVAVASVVVTSDTWVLQLAQLAGTPVFLWSGATSPARTIWNFDQAAYFADSSLPCLGCHERLGTPARNVCIRGDEACVGARLHDRVAAALGDFLTAGARVKASELRAVDAKRWSARKVKSEQLDLSAWSATGAQSVLVLLPTNPKMPLADVQRSVELAQRATAGMRGCRVVTDSTGVGPPRGIHPLRQTAMAAIRQGMITRHLRGESWVFWVDADIIDYAPTLVEELIERADGGIAAPVILMEGSPAAPPSNSDGFGPGRFYDVAGFVEQGRWARFEKPYFDQVGPVYDLESVGSCYLVNADLYRYGAAHTIDRASDAFIRANGLWETGVVRANQVGPANSFTEHYSVCQFARRCGLPVRSFADLVAVHQRV